MKYIQRILNTAIKRSKDEQLKLVERIQKNDDSIARDELCRSVYLLICSFVKSLYPSSRYNDDQFDELFNLTISNFLQLIKYYDPNRGALSIFVKFSVYNALADYNAYIHHSSHNKKQRYIDVTYTGDASVIESLGGYESDTTNDDYDDVSKELYNAINRLPDQLRDVMLMRLQGLTLAEIAERYKVSKQHIGILDNRARAALSQDTQLKKAYKISA